DVIAVDLPVDVRRIVADARVRDDRGRMAIERGPIVYCAEWPDCEGGRALDLRFDPRADFAAKEERGVRVIDTTARSLSNPTAAGQSVRLIPYHLWANRGTGQMTVWLPTRDYAPGDVGPAGGFVFYVNANYARDGWRYLEAAPFDQSAGAKWGCF